MLVVAAAAFATTKLAVATTAGVVRSPDSRWYELLDVSGRSRPPLASAVYALAPNPRVAVVVAAVVSVVATLAFAGAVRAGTAALRAPAPLQVIAFVIPLVVALSHRFLLWDVVVYSESLTLSFTQLSLAGLVHVAIDPRARWLAVTLASLGALALVREAGAVAFALQAPVAAFLAMPPLRHRFKGWAWLAVALTPLAALPLAAYAARSESGTALSPTAASLYGRDSIGPFPANFMGIYFNRLLDDPSLTEWFHDAGMPRISEHVIEAWRRDPSTSLTWGEHEVLSWAQREGRTTYMAFLLTHPRYAVTKPLEGDPAWGNLRHILLPETGFAGSNLDDQTPSSRILPGPVDRAIVLGSRIEWVAAVLAVAGALTAATLTRTRRRKLLAVPWAVLAIAALLAAAVFHGSAIEHERHGIQTALLFVNGLWAALLFAVAAATARLRAAATTPELDA